MSIKQKIMLGEKIIHSKHLIDKIENIQLSVSSFFYTFLSIVIIRTCFEFLLEPSQSVTLFDSLYYSLIDYIHIFLSWLSLFFWIVLWLKLIYKRNIFKIINIVLIAFPIICIVPIIDYIFYSGIEISYKYNFTSFLSTYINLFNPFYIVPHISTGVRIEVALVLIMAILYGLIQKQSFLKIFLATIGIYTIIFFFGYLPAVYIFFLEIDFFTILSNSLLIEKSHMHLHAMMYISLLFLQVGLFLLLLPKNVIQSLIYIVRFERLMIYIGIFLFSVTIGLKQSFVGVEIFNFYDINKILTAMLSIIFAFMYSTVINDISDEKADCISNPKRVLVQKLLSKISFTQLGNIFLFFSIIFAMLVNQHFIFLIIAILALSYIYSNPPFHLKRFFLLSHLTLTLIVGLIVVLGFCFVEANLAFKKIDIVFLNAVTMFYFVASHFKDIKDTDADKAFKTITLATIIGKEKAFIILNILVFVCIIYISIWMLQMSFFISFFTGLCFLYISYFMKNSEKSILITQAIGFILLLSYITT